jgi:mono/diheme cytochrome c family protein
VSRVRADLRADLRVGMLACAAVAAGAIGFARAEDAPDVARGRDLFMRAAPPCATCHTLSAVGATGEIGPILDELRPDRERVAAALRSGVGNMPSYRQSLSEEEIQALAAFVAAATAPGNVAAGPG